MSGVNYWGFWEIDRAVCAIHGFWDGVFVQLFAGISK